MCLKSKCKHHSKIYFNLLPFGLEVQVVLDALVGNGLAHTVNTFLFANKLSAIFLDVFTIGV